MFDVRVQMGCGQNMLCTVMDHRNVHPLGVSGDLVGVCGSARGIAFSDLARLPGTRDPRAGLLYLKHATALPHIF